MVVNLHFITFLSFHLLGINLQVGFFAITRGDLVTTGMVVGTIHDVSVCVCEMENGGN